VAGAPEPAAWVGLFGVFPAFAKSSALEDAGLFWSHQAAPEAATTPMIAIAR
jgi:hypothetical protein